MKNSKENGMSYANKIARDVEKQERIIAEQRRRDERLYLISLKEKIKNQFGLIGGSNLYEERYDRTSTRRI